MLLRSTILAQKSAKNIERVMDVFLNEVILRVSDRVTSIAKLEAKPGSCDEAYHVKIRVRLKGYRGHR
jgi:hypothetical protein